MLGILRDQIVEQRQRCRLVIQQHQNLRQLYRRGATPVARPQRDRRPQRGRPVVAGRNRHLRTDEWS